MWGTYNDTLTRHVCYADQASSFVHDMSRHLTHFTYITAKNKMYNLYVHQHMHKDGSLLSPRLGPMLLLRAETSLLVLPKVSFILTSNRLMVSLQASLTISTTTNPKDCRSSLATCRLYKVVITASAARQATAGSPTTRQRQP